MSVGKRVRRDGTVSWYIQYPVNGKRTTEIVPGATTERQARLYEAKRLAEIKQANFWNMGFDPHITFEQWAKQYLEIKEAQGRRTISHIREVVSRLTDYFGNKPLCKITKSDADRYVSWRRKGKTRCGEKMMKESTVNRDIAQLKNLFEEAVRNGKIPSNPAKYTEFLDENNVRKRVIAPEEFDRLVKFAADHIKGPLLVAYYTGMRRGEILNLTWDRVDMKRRMIILDPPNTKTNRKRLVPMNEILVRLFMELSKVRPIDHKNVFTYKGKRMETLYSAFESACKKAGIEDFHFHDLRHCFNTRARKAGIHDHVIMAITGHTTLEMFERYDTVDEEDILKAAEILEEKCSENAAQENENG